MEKPLKTAAVCEDSRCRKPVAYHIVNDIGEVRMLFCVGHAEAWSSTNKKKNWLMYEVNEHGERKEKVLDDESKHLRQLDLLDDPSSNPAGAGDLPGNLVTSDNRGGPSRDRTVSGQLESSSADQTGTREIESSPTRSLSPESEGRYYGAGQLGLSREQQIALMQPVDPQWVDIRPDGLLYLPQIHYRRLLNGVVGAGNWAMIPQTKPLVQDSRMVLHYHLYINGKFAAEAVGSMEYFAKSASSKWDDCVEGAKSDALTRCCKDIGIASELWDWRYGQAWKAEFAVQVMIQRDGKSKRVWRHKDKDPFWNEVKPGRASQGEYYRAPTMEDENNAHFNSIT